MNQYYILLGSIPHSSLSQPTHTQWSKNIRVCLGVDFDHCLVFLHSTSLWLWEWFEVAHLADLTYVFREELYLIELMLIFCLKPHKIEGLIFTGFSSMVLPITWWQCCFKNAKLLRSTFSAFTVFHLYRKIPNKPKITEKCLLKHNSVALRKGS